MLSKVLLVCWIAAALAACGPAAPAGEPLPSATPADEPAAVAPAASPTPAATAAPASSPTGPPSASDTPAAQPTETPAAALSAWETVQREVAQFRNLLERASDGYAGLALALEQEQPNPDWCGGLSAAINDFKYIGDDESAQKLADLQASQGCP